MSVPHPEPISGGLYSAVELAPGDDEVILLDQRRLPAVEEYMRMASVEQVAEAIERLAVRGAPAIGVAAAYGVVLGVRHGVGLEASVARLRRTRPTAVNLAWALDRMVRARQDVGALAAEARAIHREDVAACRAIGRIGAGVKQRMNITPANTAKSSRVRSSGTSSSKTRG